MPTAHIACQQWSHLKLLVVRLSSRMNAWHQGSHMQCQPQPTALLQHLLLLSVSHCELRIAPSPRCINKSAPLMQALPASTPSLFPIPPPKKNT